MKQKNKKMDLWVYYQVLQKLVYQEIYYQEKKIVRAGYGNKSGKEIVKAGYGHHLSSASRNKMDF